jgi:mutator protein MutT
LGPDHDVGAQGPDRARWRAGGDQIIPRPSQWRVGEPGPWSTRAPSGQPMPPVLTEDLVERVRARGRGVAVDPTDPDARHSAVLVALADGPQGAEVLLTKRSWELRNHRGEISFPGGRMEPGETPAEAAVREAHEEVALDPALVDVVGELDHISTFVSKSFIVPVVARLRQRPTLTPSNAEVARILFIPLAELYRPDTYRQEIWWRPPVKRPLHFFELDDETVWGATGRMLVQLLAIAAGVEWQPEGW